MIIFLYGEDTFRSRQKLKELQGKFIREVDPGASSLVTIDGETTALENINEVVASPSLFARKRMITIERLFANRSSTVLAAICEYLQKRYGKKKTNDQENIIIFWDEIDDSKFKGNGLFKYLITQKFVQCFKPFSTTETINWVKYEAKMRGAAIRQQAVVQLTSFFGNDLWQLNHELNKLINFKRGQKPELVKDAQVQQIEAADVDELCRGSVDENIFALTDAISNKNKALALRLFEQELNTGATESYLLHMIIRQIKILLQVREALDQGMNQRKIGGQLKIHPFVVQKSIVQVRKFSIDALKYIFHALVDIDRELKTGQTDFRSAMLLLISRV